MTWKYIKHYRILIVKLVPEDVEAWSLQILQDPRGFHWATALVFAFQPLLLHHLLQPT